MEMVVSLPIDLKIELVDRLHESISPTKAEIDELWKAKVDPRIDEVKSGEVKTIPGEEVFPEIRNRFRK